MTKERPIIFSGEMVRAILDGKKTQTRRVMKPQPEPEGMGFPDVYVWKRQHININNFGKDGFHSLCPYGKPGDRLWVRETFLQEVSGHTTVNGDWHSEWLHSIKYCADGFEKGEYQAPYHKAYFAKRPSIFMSRKQSRITLEICSVRVERLQEISEEEALSEGAEQIPIGIIQDGKFEEEFTCRARTHFRYIWDEINEKRGYSWESNPYVWVIEFRRVTP